MKAYKETGTNPEIDIVLERLSEPCEPISLKEALGKEEYQKFLESGISDIPNEELFE